jgi:hypothetical protein
MKKIALALCVLLGSVQSPVWADGGRWQTQRIDNGRVILQANGGHGQGHGYRGHHGHRQQAWGWAPWVSAAVIGSTLYWASHPTPPPATVIVTPPVVLDPNRVAYFCQTSQQYYPYVPVCNVPWQVVSY